MMPQTWWKTLLYGRLLHEKKTMPHQRHYVMAVAEVYNSNWEDLYSAGLIYVHRDTEHLQIRRQKFYHLCIFFFLTWVSTCLTAGRGSPGLPKQSCQLLRSGPNSSITRQMSEQQVLRTVTRKQLTHSRLINKFLITTFYMLRLCEMFVCVVPRLALYFNDPLPLQNFVSAYVIEDTDPVDTGHLKLIQQPNDAATEGMSACWNTCL